MNLVDSFAASLYRSVKNFLPWPQFPPFTPKPPLQLPPLMSDDDCDFHGDMIYARAMLDQICDECRINELPARHIPTIMSSTLDIALLLVRFDFADQAAELLAAWRDENTAVAA